MVSHRQGGAGAIFARVVESLALADGFVCALAVCTRYVMTLQDIDCVLHCGALPSLWMLNGISAGSRGIAQAAPAHPTKVSPLR